MAQHDHRVSSVQKSIFEVKFNVLGTGLVPLSQPDVHFSLNCVE